MPAADMSTQTANHRHASPAPSINNQSHPRRMRSETVTATSSTRTRHEDHPPNTDTVINSAQNRNERDMSGPSRISVITSNRNSNSVNITEPHYPDTDIAYTHDDEFIAARYNIRTRQYYIGNVDENVNTDIISSFLQKRNVFAKFIKILQSQRTGRCYAKIRVLLSDCDIIEQPHFWPTGIYARAWQARY